MNMTISDSRRVAPTLYDQVIQKLHESGLSCTADQDMIIASFVDPVSKFIDNVYRIKITDNQIAVWRIGSARKEPMLFYSIEMFSYFIDS